MTFRIRSTAALHQAALRGAAWFATLCFCATQTAMILAATIDPPDTEPSQTRPMGPQESADSIDLPPGFHCTLFASEPLVRQPISMTTDTKGRLWVGENYSYSEQAVNYDPNLRDRILILEDNDFDGKADKVKVFADQLERLTSVEVDHDGVWAICLPQLLFIPDRNQDDIPDGPPEVVLDGFEYMKARHTVANGLRWGPDGWLYGRQGILGTSRVGPPNAQASERVELNVGIWRYHPRQKRFEIVARGTTNPWGMDWDALGEAFFINTVIGHLWHIIPGAHYRRMFGDDADPHVYELIDQHADHVHWATNEVWTDVRKGVTDATLVAGGGHAHTGLMIYQGGQWPESWNGKLLTINFHGRRLNIERLDREGSGYVGKREPDAFAFADPWFRGIDLIASPDGGMFVSDWSDTGECHDNDGIHRNSGRIFKIAYGQPKPDTHYDLSQAPVDTLIELQNSANEWLARQARRALLARESTGKHLSEQALEGLKQLRNSSDVVHRLRGLWTQYLLGKLSAGDLISILSNADEAESMRVWALRLLLDSQPNARTAEDGTSIDPLVLQTAKTALEGKTTPALRLAFASQLQRMPIADRFEIASRLLSHASDSKDHNLPLMLWYGIYPIAELQDGSFERLIAGGAIPTVQRLGMRLLVEDIDLGTEKMDRVLASIGTTASTESCEAILEGISEGLSGRRQAPKPLQWEMATKIFLAHSDARIASRVRDLSAAFGDGRALDEVKEIAINDKADTLQRVAALQLLIDVRADGVREISERVLGTRGLSATAALGLALNSDDRAAELLLAEWPALYGHERPPIASVLVSRPQWARKFLEAIAAGKINKTSISPFQARQIASFYDADLTRLLVSTWGPIDDESNVDRKNAIAKWKNEFSPERIRTANLERGRAVFKTSCASCHILNGEGGAIGPELTGASRDNLDYLLDNLLFPSAVVPDMYRQTALRLGDGRVLTGIVRTKNRKVIRLQTATELINVAISEVEEEKQSQLSIMPSGVLDTLTMEQRLDLIGYLMNRN